MRHPTLSRGRRVLLAATAALLAIGGLTAPTWATPGGTAAADATAGCGQPPSLTTGNHTITSGGQSRTFRLDVPDGYDPNRAYRLVVGLHWWHGASQDVVNQGFYGLKPLAGGSTIFVAPQGFDNAWPNSNGQDVTFVDDVLSTVESGLCVDTTQRFATGFSYGGGMSNALACARADVFRAVAVLNGAELSGCAGGTEPVAYLGSHGVVDSVLNISQGRALRDRFLQNNGCQAQQAPEPAPGSGTHVKTSYTCQDGYPVVWIANDSDHQWDARDGGQSQSHVPGEIWQFFTSLTSTDPTPDPTPTPTATPTTTPPPAGDCTATYRTVNSWADGFQGEVTVQAGSASTSWSVSWQPSGERVDQVWNGTLTSQGDLLVVRNADWNGQLAAGGTTNFGLLGSGSAPTSALTCTSS
ncbi:hypothetical protein GCM10028784_34880 [Myceligenerans cantabricum]